MDAISFLLIITVILVLAAEFVNGWTDAPNAIATVVATRVLPPRFAVIWATVLNFIGTLLGVEIAKTIGKGIVAPESINLIAIVAAMASIVIWSSVAARFGLPTSESHALIAGLAGAAFTQSGISALQWAGWQKVIIGLAFSTFLGFTGAIVIMSGLYTLFRNVSVAKVNRGARLLQIFSSGFMALSHGTNDGQKFIGVMALAFLVGGVYSEFQVLLWMKIVAAAIMGLGTAFGGWRIIRTMGVRMTKINPVQGFAAEFASASVIQVASHFGIPLSTTHTINTSVMGAAAAKRFSAVRWPVAFRIIQAWIFTFPICGIISYVIAKFLGFILGET